MYKPGYGDYFYLTESYSYPKGHVQVRVLANDIQTGVKRLAEYAYCSAYGVTRTSMRFMNALIHLLGQEAIQGVKAELAYSQKHHFTLTVHTISGFELVFKGVSGGYYGEGTRGCYDILKVCGFNEKQCQRAFEKETFTASRRINSVSR